MKDIPRNVTESVRRRNPHLYHVVLEDGSMGTTTEPPPKRIRQSTKPLMNKLEQEWLERLKDSGPWTLLPQSIRFKLGNGIWYKPDVACFDFDGKVACWEVKGPFAHRGGFENLKVAAALYPNIKWTLAWKQDGQWQEQVVLP